MSFNPSPYDTQPGPYGAQPGGYGGYGGPAGPYGGYGFGGYGQFGAPTLSPDVAPLPGAGFGQAVKRFFQRYAQFRGYASPSEFWWAYGFLVLGTFAIYILGAVLAGILTAFASDPQSEESLAGVGLGIFALILCVFTLGTFIPYLAVAVRRLHDTGKSGALLLLVLVPFGSIVVLVLLCMASRPDLYRPEWG